MSIANEDPYDLNRFVQAQQGVYSRALTEIKQGQKRSHWMWFIFPQFAGLGFSATSRLYAINSVEEGVAYLHHPVLGPRLQQCAKAVLAINGRSALQIFGNPDTMKLQSCATLFAYVSPVGSVFSQLLDKYFEGQADIKTISLLNAEAKS